MEAQVENLCDEGFGMRWDVLIRGGTVVGPAGGFRADVAIAGGRIA